MADEKMIHTLLSSGVQIIREIAFAMQIGLQGNNECNIGRAACIEIGQQPVILAAIVMPDVSRNNYEKISSSSSQSLLDRFAKHR
jgi:hypothetical protein